MSKEESRSTLSPPLPLLLTTAQFRSVVQYLIFHLLPHGYLRTWKSALPLQTCFMVNHNSMHGSKLTKLTQLRLHESPVVQALWTDLVGPYRHLVHLLQTFIQHIFDVFTAPSQLPWRLSCYVGNWTERPKTRGWQGTPNLGQLAYFDNAPFFHIKGGYGVAWKAWNLQHFPISTRVNAEHPREKVLKKVFQTLLSQEEKETPLPSSPSKVPPKRKLQEKPSSSKKMKASLSDVSEEEEKEEISPSFSSLFSGGGGGPGSSSPSLSYPFPTCVAAPLHPYTALDQRTWKEIHWVAQFPFYLFRSILDFVMQYELELLFILFTENNPSKDFDDPEKISFERVITSFLEQPEIQWSYNLFNTLYHKYMSMDVPTSSPLPVSSK